VNTPQWEAQTTDL